jgi:hypothetical protein
MIPELSAEQALSRLVWLIFTRSPVQQGATKDSLADA